MRNFNYQGVKISSIATALPANNVQVSNGKSNALAVNEQIASDLGFLAAQQILQNQNINVEEIGALVFLSTTSDYRGPATAMVLQNRLQIPQNCIVYDAPTGNGGFENALNIGASLLKSIQQNYVLLVLGNTVSKQLSIQDFNSLNFQDGATAVLLEKSENSFEIKTAFFTISNSWNSFMLPSGGFRENKSFFNALESKRVNQSDTHLHFNEATLEDIIKLEFNQLIRKITEFSDNCQTKETLVFVNLFLPSIENNFKSELIKAGFDENSIYTFNEICPQTMAATTPLMLEIVLNKQENEMKHIVSISIGEGVSINMASFLANKSLLQETIHSDSYYDNGFVTHEM